MEFLLILEDAVASFKKKIFMESVISNFESNIK
jgi:hypothetical protein